MKIPFITPTPPKKERIWARNADGTPYAVGMTVAELRKELLRFADTDEVCVSVSRKTERNGGGLTGKLKLVVDGATGQIWLLANVLDESQE